MCNLEPIIKLEKICKNYEHTIALNNVSLNVKSGEVLAIIGHNGSGKSTLLKIISGLLQPDSGIIKVNGVSSIFESVKSAQSVGFELLTQNPPLFPHLSILENLFIGVEPAYKILGLRIIKKAEMLNLGEKLIVEFGLQASDLLKPVSNFSIGQQSLVGLIRALNKNPKLLALDEPTASLGFHERLKVNNLMTKLASNGTAIVIVSHILEDVFELSNRVAVISKGELVYFDLTKNLTEKDVIKFLSI